MHISQLSAKPSSTRTHPRTCPLSHIPRRRNRRHTISVPAIATSPPSPLHPRCHRVLGAAMQPITHPKITSVANVATSPRHHLATAHRPPRAHVFSSPPRPSLRPVCFQRPLHSYTDSGTGYVPRSRGEFDHTRRIGCYLNAAPPITTCRVTAGARKAHSPTRFRFWLCARYPALRRSNCAYMATSEAGGSGAEAWFNVTPSGCSDVWVAQTRTTYAVSFMFQVRVVAQIGLYIHSGNCPSHWAIAQGQFLAASTYTKPSPSLKLRAIAQCHFRHQLACV